MTNRKSTKDNTSYLFSRYVWLVDLIHRHEAITLEEINNHWQRSSLNPDGNSLPLRTFHNHRQAVEQMFDINIECDKRNGFRYYIDGAEDMEHDGPRSWLLNSLAVNNIISESRRLKERILFEQIPSGQKYLTGILEAMKENRVVEISYKRFWRNESLTYLVHPYCVKVFKQRWYMIAFNPLKDKVLTYSLDRIQDISLTDDTFLFPEDFNGEQYFHDSFGIIVQEELQAENVLLRVRPDKAQYFETLPLHHSQHIEKTESDHIVFGYYLRPTFDFIQEILSHGADVEVLKPQWLREELKKIIIQQLQAYQK